MPRQQFLLLGKRTMLRQQTGRRLATLVLPPSSGPSLPFITSRKLFDVGFSKHSRIKTLIDKSAAASKEAGKNTKTDDKPWPRSMRIAGYTGAVLAVPLTFFTLLNEFPFLREKVAGDDERPHDPNHHTLGKKIVNFVEKYWTSHGYFDNDIYGANQKKSNVQIAEFLDKEIAVKVYVMDHQPLMTVEIPAKMPLDISCPNLDESTLWKDGLLSKISANSGSGEDSQFSWLKSNSDNRPLAIEFPDEEDERHTAVTDHISYTDENSKGGSDDESSGTIDESNVDSDDTTMLSPHARHLLKLTHTFSAWHAHEQPSLDTKEKESGGENICGSSVEELRISELEWKEAQIQSELIDPFCTRDIDTMQSEIGEIRSELRKLRRWRWASSLLGGKKKKQ